MGKKDEEKWFRKFNEGSFLVKGWQSRMDELLQAVPETDKGDMHDLLANLGEKIGREWAKDNSTRKIDTARIQRWGEALRESKKKGSDILAKKIRKIDGEVDEALVWIKGPGT